MGLILRDNGALSVNPPTGDDFALTLHGSDWLWAVCAIYTTLLIVVVGLTFFARNGERIFHYLFTISLFTGAIAYFAMASDLGSAPVITAEGALGTREIFYARYINWFVGWTPLLLAVGVISGVSWATIIYNITLAWVWIVTYLFAAFTGTRYKWGFYAFGTVAALLLLGSLFLNGTKASSRLGDPIKKHYLGIAAYLTLFIILYPIAFGVDDGGNKITVTHGFIFWGILDIFTVPILELAILALSTAWDYKVLNVYFTQYGRVAQGGEFPEREKAPVAASAPMTTETV